jgi:hypothetical protein
MKGIQIYKSTLVLYFISVWQLQRATLSSFFDDLSEKSDLGNDKVKSILTNMILNFISFKCGKLQY